MLMHCHQCCNLKSLVGFCNLKYYQLHCNHIHKLRSTYERNVLFCNGCFQNMMHLYFVSFFGEWQGTLSFLTVLFHSKLYPKSFITLLCIGKLDLDLKTIGLSLHHQANSHFFPSTTYLVNLVGICAVFMSNSYFGKRRQPRHANPVCKSLFLFTCQFCNCKIKLLRLLSSSHQHLLLSTMA